MTDGARGLSAHPSAVPLGFGPTSEFVWSKDEGAGALVRTGGQLKLRDGRQPVWGHTVGGTRGCPPPMLRRHSTSMGSQGSHRCWGLQT